MTDDSSSIINSNNTKRCIPCETMDKSTLLSKSDIEKEIKSSLPIWSLVTITTTTTTHETDTTTDATTIHKLVKKFTAKNFVTAINYFNQIATIAERENHHPNLHLTSYREVEVELYTHSVGGVTKNDILLAQMIEKEIQMDSLYSPKWLKEHPQAKAGTRV